MKCSLLGVIINDTKKKGLGVSNWIKWMWINGDSRHALFCFLDNIVWATLGISGG